MDKNKENLLSCSGISILEIMIVTLIAIFIILTLLAVLSSSRNAWFIAGTRSDLYTNARKAMSEMFMELAEVSSGATERFTFADPIDGGYTQGIWFASSRGDSAAAGEDGSGSNFYMHLDGDNKVSWRSAVFYCTYVTAEGQRQLRRYVDYGAPVDYYSQANIFPLTFTSATANTLNFTQADGATVISIDRTGGRVLANYIASEDTNNDNILNANEDDAEASLPADNADGELNLGVNFVKNVGNIEITLFLRREVRQLKEQGRFLITTLRNIIKFRQP